MVIHESLIKYGLESLAGGHGGALDHFGQADEVNHSSRLPRTVAIVLAAGSGSRFAGGGHTLNALIGGRSVCAWALQAAIDADIGPVVLVTGAVELPVSDPGVTVVHNPQWSTGLASSLQVGIAAAQAQGAEAVVVGLGDQPFVKASAWQAVATSPAPIAVATYDTKRGNPVRLHAEIWPRLPTSGDEGARSVLRIYSNLVEEVPCEGSSSDIDTVEDLERMDNELGTWN
ncbi:MAG: nucleotidyltransferase family protein [Ilumatobacteraceae bacterium]